MKPCPVWLPVLAALLAGCSPGKVPLDTPAHAAIARFDDYPRPRVGVLPVQDSEQAIEGGCGIESVRGLHVTVANPDGSFVVDLPATLSGWAFAPDEAPGIPEAWLRMVPLGPGAEAAQFPLVAHFPRPDVAAHFASPSAAYSGFTELVVDRVPPGTYHAQVVFAAAGRRWVCSNVRQVQVQ